MKLITWNVYCRNRRIKKSLKYLFSKNPDVVGLQEVRESTIEWISENFSKYKCTTAIDGKRKRFGENVCVCLLTKLKIKKFGKLIYSSQNFSSLLGSFYKIKGFVEKHEGVYVDVLSGRNLVRIQNVRLSTAVSPRRRRGFFYSLLENKNPKAENIILGDMNVNSGHILPLVTGLFRGYHFRELFENEETTFEAILEKEGLKNVFNKTNTTIIPGTGQQFDYILISSKMRVLHKDVEEGGLGSDHRMLFLDVDL